MAFLTKINHSPTVVNIANIGGSNGQGGWSAVTYPGMPAAPYNSKPANVNYRKQGVGGQASYPNPHGVLPGFAYELYTVKGWGGTLNWLEWFVTTTDLAVWVSTHGPAFVADWVSSGLGAFHAIIHDFGGGDSQDQAHVDGADDNQDLLYASFRRRWGAVAITLPLVTPLPSVSPYVKAGLVGATTNANGWGLINEQIEYGDRRAALMSYVNTRVAPFNTTDVDQTHRLSASQIEIGRQICRDYWAAGMFA